jgi:hypothetical protein
MPPSNGARNGGKSQKNDTYKALVESVRVVHLHYNIRFGNQAVQCATPKGPGG